MAFQSVFGMTDEYSINEMFYLKEVNTLFDTSHLPDIVGVG
jgi:hypothetical protein